ncbi:MAG: L-threonylcarbamoyladenylate synthase [Bacteroidetes bacterium]|nr:L-threonylcarbamoyladenylate synthase [Bacteroidota bacterium]
MLKEIPKSFEIIQSGGIILYPTDTVYGIGCDPRNEKAVERIAGLKKRPIHKSYIILVSSAEEIKPLVSNFDKNWLKQIPSDRPTTIIYPNAKNLPKSVIAEDGSIAIRIVSHPFCTGLIKRLNGPILSTSANISGEPSPATFTDIKATILNGVDYVVNLPAAQDRVAQPSRLIKIMADGTFETIRD